MNAVLFVVTEEGYWGEECVRPLQMLEDNGFTIDVATPTGSSPTVDHRSIDPEQVGKELAEEVRECQANHPGLNDPVPLALPSARDYEAVVFPGGHGTLWDINADHHARGLLRDAVAGSEGCALVVCHAVGLLGFTRQEDGEMLVRGRNVTGFPNAWEQDLVDENDVLPDGSKLPYWVEDEVQAAGGHWDAELQDDASVTVDGDLITARGPESSEQAGRTLLEELQ